MAQIYANFQSGSITNNPLAIGGTSISSGAFANLPVVTAPDVMWLVLDPAGVNGNPEIVQVTAHASLSGSVTVVRAQQGTVARSHPVSTVWRHAGTKADFDRFATLEAADSALGARTTALELQGKGVMGYAQRTTDFSWPDAAGIKDIGVSVTFTAVAGRRYRASFSYPAVGSGLNLMVREGSTVLGQIEGSGVKGTYSSFYVNTDSISGSKTWKLSLLTLDPASSVTFSAVEPAQLLIEDIGAL